MFHLERGGNGGGQAGGVASNVGKTSVNGTTVSATFPSRGTLNIYTDVQHYYYCGLTQ